RTARHRAQTAHGERAAGGRLHPRQHGAARAPLRCEPRHRVPAPARPARRRALATLQPRPRARRHSPRHGGRNRSTGGSRPRPGRPTTGDSQMSKAFASKGDLEPKKVTFSQLSESAFAYTAEGDPNTGVIVGEDSVMVIDAQATPAMARDVIEKVRTVTDKPIRYVTLTHYHAVRVLGASAYGAEHVIASGDTYDLIVERGEADYKSE